MAQENNAQQHDLYDLIHHLDEAEQQLILQQKKKDSRTKVPKLWQLYDDLVSVGEYHEPTFKQSFQHREYMQHLPRHKNALGAKILLLLTSRLVEQGFEESGDDELSLRMRFEQVRIFIRKKLSAAAYRKLTKVMNRARKLQQYELLLEMLREERSLIAVNKGAKFARSLEQVYKESSETLAIIQEKFATLELRDQIFIRLKESAHTLTAEAKSELASILQKHFHGKLRPTGSFDALSSHLFTLAMINLKLKKSEAARKALEELVKLWNRHKEIKALRKQDYTNLLYNFILVSLDVHHVEEISGYIDHYEKICRQLKMANGEFENNRLTLRIKYFLVSCDWENALLTEREFNTPATQELIEGYLQPSRKLMYALQFTWLHLILGDFSKANKHLSPLLHASYKMEVGQDMCTHALLLQMMIQYELNHVEDLPRLYRTAYRRLKDIDVASEFDNMAMRSLKNLANKTPDKLPGYFRTQWKSLSELRDNQDDVHVLGMEVILWWLESKIAGVPMKEIVEKHQS